MPNEPVVIRRIRQDEGEVWRDIRARMVLDSTETFLEDVDELRRRPSALLAEHARAAASGGNRCVLFAEVDGRVVGSVSGVTEGAFPELFGMWVDSSCRNSGIGARLVEQLTAWASKEVGAAGLQLSVNETNSDAQRFYRRLGFEFDGRIAPSKVKPGTTILFMTRVM